MRSCGEGTAGITAAKWKMIQTSVVTAGHEPGAEQIDGETARQLAGMFKSLADPTRLRIIAFLLDGELCVNDLALALEMSQSAVSHQLSDMRAMRLVRYRRDGRRVYYALDDAHVRDLLRDALAHAGHR